MSQGRSDPGAGTYGARSRRGWLALSAAAASLILVLVAPSGCGTSW